MSHWCFPGITAHSITEWAPGSGASSAPAELLLRQPKYHLTLFPSAHFPLLELAELQLTQLQSSWPDSAAEVQER